MRNRSIATYLIAGCAGASFLYGLTFPRQLGAQGGLPESVSKRRVAGGQELDPPSAYGTTLRDLRSTFYGDLPTDTELTYSAVRGMLKAVDDPYTRFLEPKEYKALHDDNEGQFVGIGALLDGAPTREGFARIARPLSNTPAAHAGIQKGDLITKVDGKSVVGMTVDQVVGMIRGQPNTTVRLTIQRPGKPDPLELHIMREMVEIEVVQDVEVKEGNIGYVYLTQFNQLADEKLTEAVQDLKQKGMKGLIFDLRGNPGGLLDAAIDVSSRFVPPGNNAVVIVESGGQQESKKVNPRKYLDLGIPVVVLINHMSASASEIVAGAFKDTGSGTLVGTTTFGKGLVQTVFPRQQDNSAVMITTHKYLTSKGHDINRGRNRRGGVEPDVKVEETEADFIAGRDTQLDKALQILQQKTGYVKPAAAPGAPAGR